MDARGTATDAYGASACWGLVVDLRRNGGGNRWPMLAGLRPLVGEGVLGSFEGRSGRSEKWTATTEGAVRWLKQSSKCGRTNQP